MFEKLYGNIKLKELLEREITTSTLTHAYIAEGNCGSGKHTLAYEIAVAMYEESVKRNGTGAYEEILSENPKSERHNLLHRRFSDGMSPDVIVKGIVGDKKSIGVDIVRDIFSLANTTSNELDFKIIIVENADIMTIPAQNAFLKLLESPPTGVFFFLLCENSALLLPTLRSRAALLRMELFDDDTLYGIFTAGGAEHKHGMPDGDELRHVIGNSDGTVGQVKIGLENLKKIKSSGNVNSVTELLDLLVGRKSAPITVAVAKLPGDRNELITVLNQLGLSLRDILYIKNLILEDYEKEVTVDDMEDENTDGEALECRVKLLFFADTANARKYADMLSMNEIISIFDKINSAMNMLKKNGNVRLVLTVLGRDICRCIGI